MARPDVLGKYRIVEALGSTHRGTVFVATLKARPRKFRLELVPNLTTVARLVGEEAERAVGLRHPNLAKLVDHGIEHGRGVFVFDDVAGVTLADLMAAVRKHAGLLPAAVAAQITIDVCQGLQFIHEQVRKNDKPVIHGALHPSMVLVGRDGRTRVLDNGLGRVGRPNRSLFGYLAPELLDSALPTIGSDVFSAGVMLWEMLARDRLYDTDNRADLKALFATEVTPPVDVVSGLPTELSDAALAALEIEPSDRLASAAALAERLAAWSTDAVAEMGTGLVAATVIALDEPATFADRLAELDDADVLPSLDMANSEDEDPSIERLAPEAVPTASGGVVRVLKSTAGIRERFDLDEDEDEDGDDDIEIPSVGPLPVTREDRSPAAPVEPSEPADTMPATEGAAAVLHALGPDEQAPPPPGVSRAVGRVLEPSIPTADAEPEVVELDEVELAEPSPAEPPQIPPVPTPEAASSPPPTVETPAIPPTQEMVVSPEVSASMLEETTLSDDETLPFAGEDTQISPPPVAPEHRSGPPPTEEMPNVATESTVPDLDISAPEFAEQVATAPDPWAEAPAGEATPFESSDTEIMAESAKPTAQVPSPTVEAPSPQGSLMAEHGMKIFVGAAVFLGVSIFVAALVVAIAIITTGGDGGDEMPVADGDVAVEGTANDETQPDPGTADKRDDGITGGSDEEADAERMGDDNEELSFDVEETNQPDDKTSENGGGDEPVGSEEEEPAWKKRGQAMLVIRSKPNATIFLNGQKKGRTPKWLTVKPGSYNITLSNANLKRAVQKRVVVGRGQRRVVNHNF